MLEFGAHLSIGGGVDRAIERAVALGMTACQLFTKNERQWAAKPLDPEVVARFAARREAFGAERLIAHDSYLINLASPDEALRERSRLAFREELDRCDQLGIPYLVTHPGAHMGEGVEAGLARVIAAIDQVHAERPEGRAMILIETTAGQGTCLGRTFEEIAAILAGVRAGERLGVCFDTCHVFAAGYDLRDAAAYAATMDRFEALIGLDRLKVLHLNDSRKPLGSRADRHAHIGQGELGLEAFRLLVNDPRLVGRPGILETEKGDDDEFDKMNLATLRGLVAALPAVA